MPRLWPDPEIWLARVVLCAVMETIGYHFLGYTLVDYLYVVLIYSREQKQVYI